MLMHAEGPQRSGGHCEQAAPWVGAVCMSVPYSGQRMSIGNKSMRSCHAEMVSARHGGVEQT